MKIGFAFDTLGTSEVPDGKHRFLIRLSKQMKKQGIKINNKKPDIYIRLPREKRCKRAKINILRVDGLIFNTRWNYKHKNKKIVESIKESDAVVYQSKFCQDAYGKFLGVTKRSAIIFNGADPNEFLPRKPGNFFIANSRWRPHKRLPMIIECFLEALRQGIDVDLVVTGKPDKIIKHKRIKYVGWQKTGSLKKLLSKAIASLHFTWIDWCPNSMVEAIIARCPIIYTECGGHRDIAPGSGIGIKDVQWNWKKLDLYNPPRLNVQEVVNAMFVLKNKDKIYPVRDDLDIKTVCKQYISFSEKLLNK